MTLSAVVPPVETVVPGLRTRVAPGTLGGAYKLRAGAGVLALGASAIGLAQGGEAQRQFYFSYLTAYFFGLGICLGAMFFVLVQHLTRAGWSVVVRRLAENIMGVLPVMAILFLPIAAGHHTLYHHWVDAELTPGKPGFDAILAGKAGWLNVTAFFARAAGYFVIWLAIAAWFRRASLRQDQTGDPALTLKMARVAAPCMLLYALTVTFAAIDWLMTLDPHWFSTIWGVWIFSGCFISFLGVVALAAIYLQRRGILRDAITTEHYHDLGKLLFAFTVFWAYTGFSQYMLIFYANLPEETSFYHARSEGTWLAVFKLLCIGHFLVPFAFLMSRHSKRNKLTLAIGAGYMLLMHFIDLHFVVMPNLHPDGLHPSWIDLVTVLGMLALVVGCTLRNVQNSPLVPERDPRLLESLRFHNA
jgi:hypothetical protein